MQYVNGSNTYTYTYNEDGIRTCKTINGVRHDYLLDGTRIIKETVSSAGVEQYTLIYLYDEAGAPIGMKYRTPTYSPNVFDCFFFEKNLQGDIVAVYDSNGTEIATYVYTAWGECTMTYYSSASNSPGLKNPFKYRGYYHDSETNWYYLQSRYYNPTWGRFINADGYVSTGTGLLGYNMFAYCNNNPILYIDVEGDSLTWVLAVLMGALLFTLTTSEKQEPTEEQIQDAINAADNAIVEARGDLSTVDITIDLTDERNEVDSIAYAQYFERLYERSLEVAKENNIDETKLMSISHISWEYKAHKFGYNIPIAAISGSCEQIDLNVEETLGSMILRAIRRMIN